MELEQKAEAPEVVRRDPWSDPMAEERGERGAMASVSVGALIVPVAI
jgi:hypothetical protein